jgi:tetratricopeptide (TPR) repeat protein
MSYIHEALKKAQVERDLGKGSYGGIPVLRRKKSFLTAKKTVISAAVLLLVLLAFVGYSWWDHLSLPVPIESEGRGTEDRGQRTEDGGRKTEDGRRKTEDRGPSPAKPRAEESRGNIAQSYQKARAFHRDGRLNDAGMWYEKVIDMDPGHVQALNNRGVLHLRHKNYPAARKCFEKAIRLKPDYVDPYYNLACVSVAQGQSAQGLRYLKKAVSMDPAVRVWAKKDPDLDVLRGDPEFKTIVTNEKSK